MATLTERLGFGRDDRVLVIGSDLLGSCHAANEGVYESVRSGLATTASLMVPCPWARHAAATYRGEDVGVHLTLNAELESYRWGPITHAPSLLDGDGGFPRTVADVWDHADLDEARRECRAQVERAVLWGFDVSHLTTHLASLEMRPEFFDIYVELAVEFGLPIRLDGASAERAAGFPFRSLAAEEGVLFPDHVRHVRGRAIERAVFDLEPGVTEIVLEPAIDTPELRAIDPGWSARVDDHAMLTHDSGFRALIERSGAHRIGYRALRDVQTRG
ncbi:MAG TPA: polysaccharide deacetylase family protein [Acidimicrobiales bacterium]|nr:polysaccharide deacetylase family protein [Acidimicrobiales bacterium]